MTRSMSLLSMIAVLGSVVALGCSDAGGSGTGGGGAGGGGTGGDDTGGAGGEGGSNTSTPTPLDPCPAEYDTTAPEEVGFDPLVKAEAEDMLVELVTPTAIDLKNEADEVVTFAWTGPDLTEIFSAGQTVKVTARDSKWGSVATDTTFVAAVFSSQFGKSAAMGATPHGGPTFTPQGVCSSAQGTESDLTVVLGDEEVTVHPHEAVSVGDYLVRNGGIEDWTSISDYGHRMSILVVGPVPAP